jgi:rhamnose transport system ATP-binding protein
VAVLFITHRLGEVFEIADRISVFRDGRHVATRPVADWREDDVVRAMVGRELGQLFQRERQEPGEVALAVTGLGRAGTFDDVSFEVRRGEVLGLAGLVGAGRTDVALALFGIAPADRGRIEVGGRAVEITSPSDALRHGIAYLSEDRRQLGLSLPQSVAANISLPSLARYTSRLGLVDTSAEDEVAERYRRQLNIRTPSLHTPVANLSGGNQQKTMLAKWLDTARSVMILDEPTRGIDVGAKAEVHRLVGELAASGLAVVLISSDLPEVMAMSDRLLVMREGRVVLQLAAEEVAQERIMVAAVGSR